KRLSRLEEQLTKLKQQARDKEGNKHIALGTSRLNYLDPRISIAWCKKWDVPIDRIFNQNERSKFEWAEKFYILVWTGLPPASQMCIKTVSREEKVNVTENMFFSENLIIHLSVVFILFIHCTDYVKHQV
ncbi:DNA topoisomerase 1, partial [Caerostris extrusa]